MIATAPNTLITLSYNSRRQRSTLSDPNYGLMQTTYNAFGELINQTTPRGFETTYTYDKLGRTTNRIEDEGTTTWHYSTTPGFLGTLERIEGLGQITSYTYDELLRPETVIENINKQDYTTAYTYDHFGRPETITHPSGFAEQNTYNNHGYLKKIRNADDQSLLWEAQNYYAPGMLRRSVTGNGLFTENQYEPETLRLTGSFVINDSLERLQDFEYKYDTLGNMRHRIKWLSRANNQFLKEEFWYDDLNRLTDIKLNGQPTGGHDYDPEGLGNITSKTANGQQIYSNAEYGEGNHGPHAISSATPAGNVFPDDPQTAEYTSFEQLKEMRQGRKTLFINYGHHHQRISQRYLNQYHVTLKQWAGACEYITRNGQTTTLTYLSGPDGLYALHLINPDESESIRYLHTDHLGSWTAVSDEAGEVVNEQSYDAWGNRRSPSTWTNAGMAMQTPLFDRGFTGHEHLDGFQLINMNGRMYDPVVSRMLAPDNYVQTPDFSQNFNRYSYCFNNPLKYTDPDGEWAGWDDAIVGGIGFVYGYVSYGLSNGDWGWNAVGAGAIGAGTFLLGYYSGGATSAGSVANIASTAGMQGSANTMALGYGANMVAASAVSSFMPSLNMPINDNVSLSVSPAIMFGSVQKGIGFNVSGTFQYEGFSATLGTRFMSYGSNYGGGGVEGMEYWALGYDNGTSGISYSSSYYSSGGTSQQLGAFSIRHNDFALTYQNDYMFGLPADGGDRYRTAAAQLSWGKFSAGVNLFTGDPGLNGANRQTEMIDGKATYKTNRFGDNPNKYRAGVGYVGYGNMRFGRNSEGIRNHVQNKFAHDLMMGGKSPYFKVLDIQPTNYFSVGTYHPNTLW
ncbi:MAG: polymorphic toxin type 23 domain-containing protein [Bacteroidales bacterium]|nr:polymorphic toxin type 23 domain-containing protein [Bacteroidales bacterium]